MKLRILQALICLFVLSGSALAQERPDLLRLNKDQIDQIGKSQNTTASTSHRSLVTSSSRERKTALKRRKRNLPRLARKLKRSIGFAGVRFSRDYRSVNGEGNNQQNTDLGRAGIPFERMAPASYEDGSNAPGDETLPNVRTISNVCVDQIEDMPNHEGATDFVWQWGQFLDHDITHTPTMTPSELYMINIPEGDTFFDPAKSGEKLMKFERSAYLMVGGVRQQVNAITAYIDGSNVYGSDPDRALELRTLDGTGKLKTSEGGFLPHNDNGFENAPTSHDPGYFLAGDLRANEQVGLTAMHTLFVREHNYWAENIKNAFPFFDGDRIYELARAIVSGELQSITYNEFLPQLLGKNALGRYRGYNPDANPNISNEFATAAYRLGHSMLSSHLLRVDADFHSTEFGPLLLRDAFFNPKILKEQGGLDPVLRGLAFQRAQEIDVKLIDDVRNFLFGAPGSGGFDLASLNIQRARDHGLPSFNDLRRSVGLEPATSFTDISSDPKIVECLTQVYGDPEKLDLWIGGLAEDHIEGSMLGETFHYIVTDQFKRLREADRFWYQNHLPKKLVKLINQQTLAKIIRRNTGIGRELQRNVFKMRLEQ